MSSAVESIEVDVPVQVVYNQWTQFETFPDFMHGVEKVEQLSDDMTRWTMQLGGVTREFDARITEQTPDQRIAWSTIEGAEHAGAVTFHALEDNRTRVVLQLDFEPEGFVEKIGDLLGIVKDTVDTDLKKFKEFIEDRGRATGEWRGEI